MRCLCCASAIFATIADTLAHEECVTIAGFGTFATIAREAPRRQNPRTGDSIAIAASTAPWFWRGRLFRMPSTRGTHDPMLSMHLPLPSTEWRARDVLRRLIRQGPVARPLALPVSSSLPLCRFGDIDNPEERVWTLTCRQGDETLTTRRRTNRPDRSMWCRTVSASASGSTSRTFGARTSRTSPTII